MTGCRPTGGTPTPPSAEPGDRPPAAPVVAVGYSGGRDSTALLHATLVVADDLGIRVLALHVHHGLSPNADAWLDHCRQTCAVWAGEGHPVSFAARRLTDRPGSGQSVEAWARAGRHAALRDMAGAHGASLLLLGHHRQDQAETWLLQALRGGGMAGLAAMPERDDQGDRGGRDDRDDRDDRDGGIRVARPWLRRPRAELDAYLHRHRLAHIHDDSNDDPRYARNRLRLQAWPALVAAFPEAEAALAQSAGWAQQAAAALAELARMDLSAVADADGLRLERWCALSVPRRSNALRAWLAEAGQAPVSAALTQRLLDELPRARSGRWPLAAGELRLHRGALSIGASTPVVRARAAGRQSQLRIDRPGGYELEGWNGSLEVRPVDGPGVPLAWLAHVELRAREGGERFQAGIGRPPRSLKKQFQDVGVAPWDRDGPLVFSGGQLVYVPGLGLDARAVGRPGQPRVDLRWQVAGTAGPAPGGG